METGTLKKLRAAVPGTLLLLGAMPLYTFVTGNPLNAPQSADLFSAGVGVALSYVLGAVYNLYCLRAVFNGRSHSRITTNIKKRLLEMGRTTPLTDLRRDELLRGNQLMDVFYALIDSNDSLKERAKLVRDNGLIWSSIADVTVLGTVFTALYLPLWFITGYMQFLLCSGTSAVLALMAGVFLHPRAERKHIQLGNDQLDFIYTQMRNEVTKKVNAL